MALTLGEPHFVNTSALRAYCENGRQLIRPLANELHIASVELRAALREIPGNWVGGLDSKARARIVAAHLDHAGDGIEVACAGLIRTFLSFERHFIQQQSRSRKHFDLNS